MALDLKAIQQALATALDDLNQAADLKPKQLVVVGASTSEVAGKHIGSAGTKEVAEALWEVLYNFQQKTDISYAFQCCEHLNRALVVESDYSFVQQLEQVSVVPVGSAGGAMAALAFKKMKGAVMVEEVKADAGIDIGDTLIGMHLKKVAVPVRSTVKSVGEAHVTMARTRPKLIGGERAVYKVVHRDETCD
ncbi:MULTISPECIES: TIGR01440 family protein [Bacillaceae]|uniref:UPF0340 protein KS407_23360 n=1 Tax=Evansella alkalicola TaxID=745819 RepID=A0ABS6K0J5_9BACI|nr:MULTISPECIES: TIGR01440 family protein [Bacillaceae]MBU9724369.1 TIGR01440 family protein [Bacillus alkalicola]